MFTLLITACDASHEDETAKQYSINGTLYKCRFCMGSSAKVRKWYLGKSFQFENWSNAVGKLYGMNSIPHTVLLDNTN